MIDTLLQDVRHAVRFLAKRPLVTAVAVLSLALGIGVNTAIFSVFDRLLLSRLPVPAPEELVNLTSPGPHPGLSPAATVSLQTLEGALQLSGNGQWSGGRVRFQGEARAAPDNEAALNNLLNIIGRRQGALAIISIG